MFCNQAHSQFPYERLISSPLKVAEGRGSYQLLSERHLQAIWLEQKYFKGLQTKEQEAIEVVSPGIWNGEAGPDFLKAHLRIGPKNFYGDVEIDFRDENWIDHRHHENERYNETVLHVSYWKGIGEKSLRTQKGERVLCTYLEPSLTLSPDRLVQLIDLDLYPYKKFLGSGRCAQQLFSQLSEGEVKKLFEDAASWRLIRKKRWLENQAYSFDLNDQFRVGIARALGYKNNADVFLGLFHLLKGSSLTNEQELLAQALGLSGFFDVYFQEKWGDSLFYQRLMQFFNGMSLPSLKMKLHQIRPLNHPVRRLVYLTKFLLDPKAIFLFERMHQVWKVGKESFGQLRQELINQIPTYEDSYWNSIYLFETTPAQEILPLMGEELKKEILLNAFLPLLFAEILERDDGAEKETFKHFYASIPASQTGKSRYLQHRFFGDTPKGSLLKKGEAQQGAYQLHHDFCVHFEASCHGCPFINNYRSLYD